MYPLFCLLLRDCIVDTNRLTFSEHMFTNPETLNPENHGAFGGEMLLN